ncbi:MAG: hypothetical protein OdinLCB4_007365 [Candidatus Odinarchaeum yellowstonii]|uniref:Uncharacterized protein n=1 Tax=Odinarchaeota yellowstonii (strain LCB_4) TaxID=1841599 RepID=A0AAF0D267_ODILC|nr:MAG: hypothetical protein OdinLCB4_007365 [Candidatus Odinarchaeum yellowstonii]
MELIEEYVEDELVKNIILDVEAVPGFTVAYKNLFNGVYVFPVKLAERVLLVVSLDRTRFWVKR